jgi:hypothetical protein
MDTTSTCAGAFRLSWADLGYIELVTIPSFSFSFSARLRKFVENSRKMIKIGDQFYWTYKFL